MDYAYSNVKTQNIYYNNINILDNQNKLHLSLFPDLNVKITFIPYSNDSIWHPSTNDGSGNTTDGKLKLQISHNQTQHHY